MELKIKAILLIAVLAVCGASCSREVSTDQPANASVDASSTAEPPKPEPGDELLSSKSSTTASPIGRFDFKNFTFQIPRGWQDADGESVELVNGNRPLSQKEKKIGFEYVTAKYFDVTGDGIDEAAVVLRIDTGGASIPQIVYMFEWKGESPRPLWTFRTGDRSDAGIKNFYSENGEFVLELFGKDRYILGDVETARITGDEEDICCPTHFTVSRYKLSGSAFRLVGKRLTYDINNPLGPPSENLGDVPNPKAKK